MKKINYDLNIDIKTPIITINVKNDPEIIPIILNDKIEYLG